MQQCALLGAHRRRGPALTPRSLRGQVAVCSTASHSTAHHNRCMCLWRHFHGLVTCNQGSRHVRSAKHTSCGPRQLALHLRQARMQRYEVPAHSAGSYGKESQHQHDSRRTRRGPPAVHMLPVTLRAHVLADLDITSRHTSVLLGL
jgi:hypothetical protein